MKKYVKPVLVFEDLNLTQHIAGNCEIILKNNTSADLCIGYGDAVGGYIIFVSETCDEFGDQIPEDAEIEGYCYYKFENPFTTFIS